MTPAFGQGANLGLELACELADLIVSGGDGIGGGCCLQLGAGGPGGIRECLEGYWRGRIDRAREVNLFSRRRGYDGQERANAAVAVAESNGPPDAQRPSRQQGEAGDELGEGEEQRGRSPPRPEKRAESPRPSGRMSPTTGGEGWLNA